MIARRPKSNVSLGAVVQVGEGRGANNVPTATRTITSTNGSGTQSECSKYHSGVHHAGRLTTMQGDPSPTRTRLVIADDHPLFRIALRQILCEQSNLEVVGEAGDGNEALVLCRRLRPDLVLMDVRMPELDGIEATRVIKQEMPRTIVLIVTSFEDRDYLLESLKAGAAGYILKGATPEEIVEAIQKVLSGESPLNQGLAAQLLSHLVHRMKEEDARRYRTPERFPEEPREPLPSRLLTSREVEVLRLLALGRTNRQIAQELSIALSTVKNHVQHIIAKLGVSDRTQASVRAVELGLFPAEQGEE